MNNLDLKTKQVVVKQLAKQYKKSPKKEKGVILTELVRLTGYNRSYARKPPVKRKVQRRTKVSKYQVILKPLRRLWVISNFACGQLLVSAIPDLLEQLIKFDEIKVTKKEGKLLLKISSATVNRLLKPDRKRLEIKGRSGTKPGTLLKHQIPVRIFTPWDEQIPGFLEIDLVAHCGESLVDTYINTLDAVDISTTWTEKQALMGKGERLTVEAFENLEKRFPFKILGIDSDNGSEFINWHFLRLTQRRKITFTRSRAYRKNDQAHVEQKNFSTVRKIIGYRRLETEKQLAILNRIYQLLSDYLNFFLPTLKLVSKETIGSKVKRIYGKPKTPYLRILEHPDIPEEIKTNLRKKYQTLNPAALLREINKLGRELTKS